MRGKQEVKKQKSAEAERSTDADQRPGRQFRDVYTRQTIRYTWTRQSEDAVEPRSPQTGAACQLDTAMHGVQTFVHEDSQFELDPLRDLQPVELA